MQNRAVLRSSSLAAQRWRIAARWRDPLAVLLLALLPLLVFAPVALLRATFYVHDVQHYFYPYHMLPARLLAQGQLPLWNQYAFSGLPLLGDGQTALFYPPNWLFFLLPGVAALNYAVLLQFSIAGVGSYGFARCVGLWRLPAFVVALSYMFCGFMTARVVHLSILSGAALLPLVFCGVELALRTNRARWYAAAALAVALQALAGHPQVPVYTALGVALYTFARAVARCRATGRWRALISMPLRLAGIYALGYALAAVQLLPWIELAAQSPRAAGTSFDFVFGSSMAGSNWLLFLFPYLYGSVGTSVYAAQPMSIGTAVKTWEHSAYVGMLPLALALVALLGLFHKTNDERPTKNDRVPEHHRVIVSSRHLVTSLALLLLLGLLLAAGKHTPLAQLIYATPVVGKLRDAERAIVLAAFALAMLAGCGMQQLIEHTREMRWRVALAALLIGALPLGVLGLAQQATVQEWLLLTPRDLQNLRVSQPNAAVPLLLGLASAALLGAWLWNRRAASIPVLMVGLVLLDMGSYAAVFNPTTDPQLYRYQPGSVAFLRQDSGPYRVATWLANNAEENRAAQEQLAVSWGMVYGIESINGFNSLQPRRYTDYLFSPETQDVSYGKLTDERLLQPNNSILSSLNVKYLLVPADATPRLGSQFRQVYANQDVRIYENTRVYPRAFFADSARRAPDQQALLQAVSAPYFDGRRVALIEAAQLPALPFSDAPADVTITRMAANQITLTTTTTAPRLLVLSEMYFAGWRATVDGAETPIYRTNYLFRGIVVPPGTHTVEFSYRPWSVLIGATISALAFVLTAWMLLRRKEQVPQ